MALRSARLRLGGWRGNQPPRRCPSERKVVGLLATSPHVNSPATCRTIDQGLQDAMCLACRSAVLAMGKGLAGAYAAGRERINHRTDMSGRLKVATVNVPRFRPGPNDSSTAVFSTHRTPFRHYDWHVHASSARPCDL
ncbi:uncharacterized protein N7459_008165 [Penicillium hispanicum]|uniref:uncharacterized protein n=1 Tax=Penicillium hispanicum TaxID=1080232 RepID=UPI002541471F|nr:uncharacterized protein N7459_008165 [Penicillium hispanicum]KAJ5573738.1 hypothetical protein N7459_008165 [Penicillium hispanicum]